VVLGCTHYPFVRAQIDRALGGGVSFFDGGAGTARRLRCRLEETELVSGRARPGRIELASSEDTPAQLALYREFLTLPL
jgi:glutamate racemase